MMLNVGSGGTDVCTGFVQGYPLLPVYAGEMAGPCLGVDVAAFDADGNEVVGELGELVIRQPDAVDAGRGSGTTRTARATAPPTSTTTRASGATATGSCSPSAAPR